MRRFIPLLIVVGVLARENPFILPKNLPSSISSEAVSSSSSAPKLLKEIKTEFLTISIFEDFLTIQSLDRLKKVFTLERLKKVVADFSSSRSFSSKHYTLNHPFFKRVDIGAHDGFYRLAIRVECDPKIQKEEKGIEVYCQ